jgi:hypothetical protein
MAIYDNAASIINDVCVEVGLDENDDPFDSTDKSIAKLCRLLTLCGRELIGVHQWQRMVREHSITTDSLDTGSYPLPTDYLYFIDQTGWTPTNRLPLGGPLSAQDWSFIVGSGFQQQTIYISFREFEGTINILPNDPVPDGIEITFEYISNCFAVTVPGGGAINRVTDGTDSILFPPILIQKFLKLRYLESIGFPTDAAMDQFNNALATWLPKDKSAPVLNMTGKRLYPYIDWRNIPETNYGPP